MKRCILGFIGHGRRGTRGTNGTTRWSWIERLRIEIHSIFRALNVEELGAIGGKICNIGIGQIKEKKKRYQREGGKGVGLISWTLLRGQWLSATHCTWFGSIWLLLNWLCFWGWNIGVRYGYRLLELIAGMVFLLWKWEVEDYQYFVLISK